jgi:hypothetical protein
MVWLIVQYHYVPKTKMVFSETGGAHSYSFKLELSINAADIAEISYLLMAGNLLKCTYMQKTKCCTFTEIIF